MRCLPAFVLLFGVALGGGVPYMAAAQEPEAVQQAPADEPKVQRPAPQMRSEALAAGLQRQLDAAAQLQLGEEDKFLALWQPANTAKARGVLVIVPSEGETADWPRAIGPLRRGLPEHGWHTLSLTPADAALTPGPRIPVPPAATEAPDTQEAPDADETGQPSDPDSAGYLPEQTAPAGSDEPATEPPQAKENAEQPSHAERMQARIDAAIEHARTLQAPMIVLVGHGTGAYWASQYMAQLQTPDIGQLAVIDPRTPPMPEQPLEAYLATLAVGVGDFYMNDRPAAQEQAMQRRNAARRAGHGDYRQVALTNLTGDRHYEQEQLVRRVRGWLDRKPAR